MTKHDRPICRELAALTMAAAITLGLISGTETQAAKQQGEVVLQKDNLKYHNINPAIQMAPAYGDKSNSAHGTFGKFPAKFETPFHTHSGAYHGVVLKGVMTNPFKGQKNPPKMKPGSYWHVPANSVHSTACISDTPCEFYFHAGRGFDFKPVK
ncbi:MAG: DUF4437 domain-containing protein [Pseudomonadales bacterium]